MTLVLVAKDVRYSQNDCISDIIVYNCSYVLNFFQQVIQAMTMRPKTARNIALFQDLMEERKTVVNVRQHVLI